MTKELLQKLLTDNGIEITEDVKVDEIFSGIDASIKEVKVGVEKKVTSKFEGEEYAKDIINKHYKENGFNNQDDFKAKLKGTNANTSEIEEQLARLQKENKEKDDNINSLSSFKDKASNLEKEKSLYSKGINLDDIEYVNFQVNKNVSDEVDYETALSTYLENDGSKYVGGNQTNGSFINKTTPPPPNGNASGYTKEQLEQVGLTEEDLI